MNTADLTIAIAVSATAAFAADRGPISIIGITLGAPLQANAREVPPPPDFPAFGVHSFQVLLGSEQRPAFLKYDTAAVRVIDGMVEGVTIFTSGVNGQDEALSQLTEQFGEPTSAQHKFKQNGAGAAFGYVDARWQVGTSMVHFEGVTNDLDTGVINISSAKMMAKEVEQGRAMHATGPHL